MTKSDYICQMVEDDGQQKRVTTEVNKSHFADQILGKEIKQRRVMKGMSQCDLAKKLGITFQQIQKYERGVNRVVVSRLYDLSRALSVDIRDFFVNFPKYDPNDDDAHSTETADSANEDADHFVYDHEVGSKEILMLVRSYSSIANTKIRDSIYALVKSLAAQDELDQSIEGNLDLIQIENNRDI